MGLKLRRPVLILLNHRAFQDWNCKQQFLLRLAIMIQKEHLYEISSTHYWSDRSDAIGQIRGESRRHPAFTANRLSEILDASEREQWLHYPGKLNPVDDASRGLKQMQLLQIAAG